MTDHTYPSAQRAERQRLGSRPAEGGADSHGGQLPLQLFGVAPLGLRVHRTDQREVVVLRQAVQCGELRRVASRPQGPGQVGRSNQDTHPYLRLGPHTRYRVWEPFTQSDSTAAWRAAPAVPPRIIPVCAGRHTEPSSGRSTQRDTPPSGTGFYRRRTRQSRTVPPGSPTPFQRAAA